VGDYNAFHFNDGYTDSIGTIKGTPTPSNEVVLASSDLVNPDLTDLLDFVPADQRYSFSFDGNAQVLDHELITSNLLPSFSRIVYARNNGDIQRHFVMIQIGQNDYPIMIWQSLISISRQLLVRSLYLPRVSLSTARAEMER
jgi:hypothetical protein